MVAGVQLTVIIQQRRRAVLNALHHNAQPGLGVVVIKALTLAGDIFFWWFLILPETGTHVKFNKIYTLADLLNLCLKIKNY